MCIIYVRNANIQLMDSSEQFRYRIIKIFDSVTIAVSINFIIYFMFYTIYILYPRNILNQIYIISFISIVFNFIFYIFVYIFTFLYILLIISFLISSYREKKLKFRKQILIIVSSIFSDYEKFDCNYEIYISVKDILLIVKK